jgi:hypothetical protein
MLQQVDDEIVNLRRKREVLSASLIRFNTVPVSGKTRIRNVKFPTRHSTVSKSWKYRRTKPLIVDL